MISIFGGGGSLGLRFLPMLRAQMPHLKTRCLIRESADRIDASVRHCIDEVVIYTTGALMQVIYYVEFCSNTHLVFIYQTKSEVASSNFAYHHQHHHYSRDCIVIFIYQSC